MPERRAEIADDVIQFVTAVRLDDHVVGVFQIPVVDQGHHDLQTLQFRSAIERIAFPLPFVPTLSLVRTCFKPDVCKGSFSRYGDAWHEIVDLGVVTETPQQSDC